MKKIAFFVSALVLMMFSFASCGNNNEPNDPNGNGGGNKDTISNVNPTDTVQLTLKFHQGAFVGEDLYDGVHSFKTVLRTSDVTIDKEGTASGTGYYFVIYFNAIKGNELFPALGDYKVATTGAANTLTVEGYKMDNGASTKLDIVKGQLNLTKPSSSSVVKGSLMSADVNYVVSFTGNLRYQGKCTKYYLEDMKKINETFEVSSYEFIQKSGNQQGFDIYDIFLYGAEYSVYVKLNSKGLAGTDMTKLVGEYTIKPGDVENSVNRGFSEPKKGPNGEDGYSLRPTYACTQDERGNANAIWWGYDGTVKIENNKIIVKFTSAYGSTFTVTYNGQVVATTPAGAPAL